MAGPKALQHVLARGGLVARALDAGGPLSVQRVAHSQLELVAAAVAAAVARASALRFDSSQSTHSGSSGGTDTMASVGNIFRRLAREMYMMLLFLPVC